MNPERFFVGVDAHMIGLKAPIMVSDLRLRTRKTLRQAADAVMIDSGSFTIHDRGQSFDPAAQYVDRIRRYQAEIGGVISVSTYGRMCEPPILAKTGSTVDRNLHLTVESYLELTQLAPDVPWLPEIQGWQEADYHRCIEIYASNGVDLASLPAVGVGSICRRQSTIEAQRIVAGITIRGIKVHGFGVKTTGLLKRHMNFHSADSFAWSFGARKRLGLCPHGAVKWETNCPHRAMDWREDILNRLADDSQAHLF